MPPDFAARLSGRRLLHLRRRAKYIIAEFDDGTAMLLHLGMSGRMTISAAAPAQFDKHDHLIFMAEGGPVVCFNDARRFGVVDLATTATIDAHPLLAALGPEPLGNHFNGPVLAAGLRGRGTAIKPLLLDQRLVAGIGNIYASEALFRAGISPRRKGGSVTGGPRRSPGRGHSRGPRGGDCAGGASLRDHVQPNGELGYFQHAFQVYGRTGEACNTGCGRPIQRLVQTGRTTFSVPIVSARTAIHRAIQSGTIERVHDARQMGTADDGGDGDRRHLMGAGQAADFVAGFDDLPLMTALSEIPEAAVTFDTAAGRIVIAVAEGRADRAAVIAYYSRVLPHGGAGRRPRAVVLTARGNVWFSIFRPPTAV